MESNITGVYIGQNVGDETDLWFRLPDGHTLDLAGLMLLLEKQVRSQLGVCLPEVPFVITVKTDLSPIERTAVPGWQQTFLAAIRNRRTVLVALREADVGQRELRDALANDRAFAISFEQAQKIARPPKAKERPQALLSDLEPVPEQVMGAPVGRGQLRLRWAKDPPWVEPVLAALREGLSIPQAAVRAKITRQAIYERRKQYPDFARMIEEAIQVHTLRQATAALESQKAAAEES